MPAARGPIVPPPSSGITRRRALVATAVGLTIPAWNGVRWAGAAPRSKRTADLDDEILTLMRAARVPGVAACVVTTDGVIWSGGYGRANIAHHRPATPDTMFMLASISKTVMSIAVMQAVEDGLLDLDADVNDVLPFGVRNPRHPGDAITLRMLLTHTSSIRDDWPTIVPFYSHGDSPIALGAYLERYLEPGGDLFHAERNYAPWAPGHRYEYCNMAASLAGFMVEAGSGVAFDRWCEERIFTPLGMDRTSWHLAGLQRSEIAMPYHWTDRSFVAYGQYGYPDYPDGALRTSALGLAKHLQAFMAFGELDGVRILREDTVREMRRAQFPDVAHGQGLIWYRFTLRGMPIMGHNGGDSGVATQMYFRPRDGVGVIVLANGGWRRVGGSWPLQRIAVRLFGSAGRTSD